MSNTTPTDPANFRALHDGPRPLALSNVWDAASAVIAQAAGAKALATTSAGVAWSLGCADGDQLDRAQAVDAIARIVGTVSVPVSADLEGGFATSPGGVAQTVIKVMEAGVVGINIEDGSRDPEELVRRIRSARTAAEGHGGHLFINARTDVFLAGVGTEDEQVAEALRRAQRYIHAGADGIFVPGASSEVAIRALVCGISAPVNVMVGPGSLSVAELGELGVARVSLGSNVAQAAYAVAQRAATELAEYGTYDSVAEALDYGVVNSLFTSMPARRRVDA